MNRAASLPFPAHDSVASGAEAESLRGFIVMAVVIF